MRFPTMWYVRPAKPQISLRIRAVWSEPLLVAWVFYDCLATDWTPFGVFKLNMRLQRIVRVYTCQNVKLLEISCTGPIIKQLLTMSHGCPVHVDKHNSVNNFTPPPPPPDPLGGVSKVKYFNCPLPNKSVVIILSRNSAYEQMNRYDTNEAKF